MENCDNQMDNSNNSPTTESIADDSSTIVVECIGTPFGFPAGPGAATITECTSDDSDVEDSQSFVDLSAVKAANEVIEQTLALEDTNFVAASDSNEAYDSIMNVCSTAAHEIRKTISDVLNCRESVVITEVDPTDELEESLSKKIADFENVVSGCFSSQQLDTKGSLPKLKETSNSNNNTNEKDSIVVKMETVVNSSGDLKEEINTNVQTTVPMTISNVDSKSLDPSPSVENSSNSPTMQENEKLDEKDTKIQPVTITKDAEKCPLFSEDNKHVKKQQKNTSNKRKGEKTVDQVLKSLSTFSTSEEKLQALSKKHVEALDELRLFEPRLRNLERQVFAQQREREQLQAEHNRMILVKSRLESLCRELQRQSKLTKEESLLRIKEEEEKRKEVANKFQATLNDLSSLMQENAKKNIQLREENVELAKKLKTLVDHYDMWEKHMEKVLQQKDLETQLSKAKHAKTNLLLKQETEKFLREKQALLENMSELQKKCTMLTSNELQLRTELGDYTSKYEEFQTVLNKSSQVFASFKNDMEATSKKIKKLEKETNVYKQKWESSNNALLGMINDKEKHDKELTNAHQRILTLEKLCRALQAERNELQNQLNAISAVSRTATEKEVPIQSPGASVVME